MKNTVRNWPRTDVVLTLPAHRILYTGLNKRAASAAAAVARKSGLTVTRQRVRVLGSKLTDPNPWHYTVIAHGATQATLDSVVR